MRTLSRSDFLSALNLQEDESAGRSRVREDSPRRMDSMKHALVLVCLTLPSLVGCGVTSLQKEVDWYKQQLTISEDDRHRLELELADCEKDGQGWATRNNTLRADLDQARRDLAHAGVIDAEEAGAVEGHGVGEADDPA